MSNGAAPVYSVAPTTSVVPENRQLRLLKPGFRQLTVFEENISFGFGFGYRNNRNY